MMKTMIAGLTAIALSVTPVHAQDSHTSNDDLGKFLFGLVAITALGAALSKNSRSDGEAQQVHQPRYDPPVVRDRAAPRINPAPRVHQPRADRDWHQPPVVQPRGYGQVADRRALPGRCFYTARTRFGAQNLFGYRCLQENFRHAARLPEQCKTRVHTLSGIHNGYDPLCLRQEGYRIARRR